MTKQKCVVSVPSGDHVILDYHDFFHIRNPQCISIRTLASDAESLDSPNIPLSSQLLEEVTRGQSTVILPKVSKVVLGPIAVQDTKLQVPCSIEAGVIPSPL